ncbi:MAG: YbfB/YjiJ family MFS transporter [Rhizobiaceae bacterium]|nr:YbfB/YjiJ family MFS transporter [Rhizobiaceae bacterium]
MSTESISALKVALAGMIGMAAVMGIGRFVFTPILPGMMDGLSLSAADGGLIASANYLGYLVGALVASGGWGAGRERLVILTGMFASAALAAAMAMTADMAAFLAIRFAAGVASALVMVFLSSIVFDRLARVGREELTALHFGGVGFGIALSSLLIAALLHAGSDWRQGWIWSGVASLAAALALVALVGKPAATGSKIVAEPRLHLDLKLMRVVLSYGLFGFGYVVTATFLVAIVRLGEGGRLFEAWVWLATGLAGIPSVWLWNTVAARIGLFGAYATGCAVELVGVVVSVTVGGSAGPLIGGVLLGATFIGVTALGLQASRRLAPHAPRRIIALMTAAFGLGQIIGPVMAGYLADWTGSFVLPSLLAAAALGVCAMLVANISVPGRG